MNPGLERIRFRLRALGLAADARTAAALIRLKVRSGPADPVTLRLKPLGGHPIRVRPGTADAWAVPDTFVPAMHLPPAEIASDDVRRLWDLGANIGLTMAHLAVLFPSAHVLGVELDADNAALCRGNIARWADRCELIEAAVWRADGEVRYAQESGNELGFHVSDQEDHPIEASTARAISLNSLLARDGGGPIDFVKMDIEGAEREVLRIDTEWAYAVRSINVEVHSPYTVGECLSDLEALGFRATAVHGSWSWSSSVARPVLGLRPAKGGSPA